LGMKDLKGGKDPAVIRKDEKSIVVLGQPHKGGFIAKDARTSNLIVFKIQKV